jgi:hypothetical protein
MCFNTQRTSVHLSIDAFKYFQSCHACRDNTRAGFDSAPRTSVGKGSSSILRYGTPLNAVGAAHIKHQGHLLTYKKTRAFERACTVSQ